MYQIVSFPKHSSTRLGRGLDGLSPGETRLARAFGKYDTIGDADLGRHGSCMRERSLAGREDSIFGRAPVRREDRFRSERGAVSTSIGGVLSVWRRTTVGAGELARI
jgi:hypothetical protein